MHPKNTRSEKTCPQCGKTFRVKPSHMDRRRFCSMACKAESMRGQWLTPEVVARFWSRVKTSPDTDACWEWQAQRNEDGYGLISVNGRSRIASRISAEIAFGPCPDGLITCHTCNNPPCVNPRHLYYGTHLDNVRDMIRSGNHRHYTSEEVRGEASVSARLTTEDVLNIRRRWAVKRFNITEEARRRGVTPAAIGHVVRHRTWRHLPSVDELRDMG